MPKPKGEGFDVEIPREVIRLRKQDENEPDEPEAMRDVSMLALGTASASIAEAAE